MTTLSTSLFDNLYKDFIGAQKLTDRLNSFYERQQTASGFPPYNIIERDAGYTIEVALAGYDKSEITISNEDNVIVVSGKKGDKSSSKYVWCGIAARNFERRFLIEDNIKVIDAEMTDGILRIDLQKIVPEKPKSTLIQIK
jgi:molecular chaperone IbpA